MKFVKLRLSENIVLNLFKLADGKIVHIETERLGDIKKNLPPHIVCYCQKKMENEEIKPMQYLAAKVELKDFTPKEAMGYYSYYRYSEYLFEPATL